MTKIDSKSIACPKGVFDIIPQDPTKAIDWKNSSVWQFVEKTIHDLVKLYNIKEVRTPIFEKKNLFQRSVGQDSDIVSKEMYTFLDRKDREFCLRPEGTAALIRCFIENQLDKSSSPHRFFYIGPMFRYERQQKGRYRQHHQFGVEILGPSSPIQDAECIELLYSFYRQLGLKEISVHINTLGDSESRALFQKNLINYLKSFESDLSEDSKKRLQSNPLRILDSKDKNDQEILNGAPALKDFLNEKSKEHFHTVIKTLESLGIPYTISDRLVRGLDYYSDTVFEIVAETSKAAQNSIGGGGRYNHLVEELGGPALPGIGFATGIERVIQTLLEQSTHLPIQDQIHLCLLPQNEDLQVDCLQIASQLRQAGVSAFVPFTHKKLKQHFSNLEKVKPSYVTVIGPDEVKNQRCKVKHWESREEKELSFTQLIDLGAYK